MTEVTVFTCIHCNGAGGTGPTRIATGLPFHPCMYCGGAGKLRREVDDWDDERRNKQADHFSRLGSKYGGWKPRRAR